MVTEVIAHTLEDVARISRERGVPSPTTLVVVGDNTVKECKNTWLMSYLSGLVSHHKMKPLGWTINLTRFFCDFTPPNIV